jgi:hypothetical protein
VSIGPQVQALLRQRLTATTTANARIDAPRAARQLPRDNAPCTREEQAADAASVSVERLPSCDGHELLVAQLQALRVGLFVGSAWLQDGGAVELLQAASEHRAVDLVE